jgi:beta-galactosidase
MSVKGCTWLPVFALVGCWLLPSIAAKAQDTSDGPQFSSKVQEKVRAVPGLLLGTAWYPEQWEEARWEQDLKLMEAANIRVVRIAEYAWSRMEPAENRCDFDWLERAVALAAKHGIFVVLGTPTNAPPAWLTQKYPDVLRVTKQGRRVTHGEREHYSYASARYLEFGRRIAEAMAQRFGHNSNVIGWQIDNQYGIDRISYDEDTHRQFQKWLKDRYGSLESLNQHWATNYWSQTYDNWEEIPFPIGRPNPSLTLEWQRFCSDVNRSYTRNQLLAIRAHADPRQFFTHNFDDGDDFDFNVTTADLTFVSYDNYVGTGHLDAAQNGMLLDIERGLKQKNFWIMETQPGAIANWAPVSNQLDRGEVRDLAWEYIGHGADAVNYWQWRSAPSGQEQYHGTLIGQDGRPVPVYQEIAQVGQEFTQVGDLFRETSPLSQTALLYDYESNWAIQGQKQHQDFDTSLHTLSYYRPLEALTHEIDIVNPSVPLGRYLLVVAPHLNVLPDSVANHLLDYVRAGGHLVLGPRSGMKDAYNAFLPSRQPGTVLTEALGGDVVQFYALEKPVPVSGLKSDGEAKIWGEMLETATPDTEVLLRYGKSNGWLDGKPAVISRRVGKGRITYVGAWLDDKLMDALASWMVKSSGVQPPIDAVPQGVEVCRRVGAGKEILILINHTAESKTVSLPRMMHEILRGGTPARTVTLPPREVAVMVPTT